MVVSGVEDGGPLAARYWCTCSEIRSNKAVSADVKRLVELGREGSSLSGEEPSAAPEPREARLTEREREALSYLALGWETKYIAEEMGVSWYTTRNHIFWR